MSLDARSKSRLAMHVRADRAAGLESVVQGAPSASAPVVRVPEAVAEEPPAPAVPVAAPLFVAAPPAAAAAPLSPAQKAAALAAMDDGEVKGCTRCPLGATRKHTVFGEGDPDAQLMFIGEGPGETEDLTGRPFVGRAGQLLDKMIAGMGLRRQDVFIANIVKCRPPGNRTPAEIEVATCTPYLIRQIDIIRPRVIVTLGLPATQYMLEKKISMGRMRGQWHDWRGIRLMPTFHPSYVLRVYTQEVRRAVWDDLRMVMAELKIPRGDSTKSNF